MRKHKKNGQFAKTPPEEHVYLGNEKAYKHEWYLKNRERCLKENRERYQKNKEKINLVNKLWHKNNPEKVRKIKLKNKDKKRFGGNRQIVLERDNNKCVTCNSKDKLVIHHIDETNNRRENNANNSLENLVTLCRSCHGKIHGFKKKI